MKKSELTRWNNGFMEYRIVELTGKASGQNYGWAMESREILGDNMWEHDQYLSDLGVTHNRAEGGIAPSSMSQGAHVGQGKQQC